MKVGVALGGGGAKGFAHIGVLQVLKEAGVQVDLVAGTSIGALVGAVFAAGSLHHLEREALDLKITDIPGLLSPSWCLSGLFTGANAFELLSGLVEVEQFAELPLPFATISADLYTGEAVVHRAGRIHEAVRASAAIPAVFTPVLLDGRVLVDGGTVEPVPVEAARQLGADVVIAVDLFGGGAPGPSSTPRIEASAWPDPIRSSLSYLRSIASKLPWSEQRAPEEPTGPRLPNILEVIDGTLAISQKMLTGFRLALHPPDLLIQPELSAVGMLDFHQGARAIAEGRRAALAQLDQITALLERLPANNPAAAKEP